MVDIARNRKYHPRHGVGLRTRSKDFHESWRCYPLRHKGLWVSRGRVFSGARIPVIMAAAAEGRFYMPELADGPFERLGTISGSELWLIHRCPAKIARNRRWSAPFKSIRIIWQRSFLKDGKT